MSLLSRRLPCALLIGVVLSCLWTACGHYRLGTEGQLAFHKLYIAPVTSVASIPQARALVGTQLREVFLRDSRVELVNSAEEAEATLEVVLQSYNRAPTVARDDDIGLARQFALDLSADCTLRLKDRLLFEKRRITATREAFTDGGQLQSEYQTMPLLAETLARNVAHATLDVW